VEPRVSVADFERAAAERLEPAWYDYVAGAAGDERTAAENIAALARVRFRPRILAGLETVSPATTTLGLDLSFPLIVAPVGYLGFAHSDGELGMARATAAAGIGMCLSTFCTSTVAEVADAGAGAPLLYQVYVFRDRGYTSDLIAQAVDAGCRAVVLTADLAVVGKRDRERRHEWGKPDARLPAVAELLSRGFDAKGLDLIDPALDWAYLEELAGSLDVPLVVKGVHTPEDAALAAEHGAAGVVVSNHGGRQLDGVEASIEILPRVAETVGDRLEVWMDGGIRRGTDIAKALCLGARAVLAGRAPVWGLAADGEAGAAAVIELLKEELEIALHLLGCSSVQDLGPEYVRVGL
jgi:isopentenyl diphosphate isomerase/L-lactate dehydrogenase-like FMN-dependent dehydrogenase